MGEWRREREGPENIRVCCLTAVPRLIVGGRDGVGADDGERKNDGGGELHFGFGMRKVRWL
jgi:hypothetical protein